MSQWKFVPFAAAVCMAVAGPAEAQGLGFAGFSASINAAGQTVRGVGVLNSARPSGGVYVINFTRSVVDCTIVATLEGVDGGQASVERQGVPSRIRVYTFNKIGQAANRPFMVMLSCVS